MEFTYDQFEQLCGPQLVGNGFPTALWRRTYEKLQQNMFDAGSCFQLAAVEQEDEEEGEGEEDKKGNPTTAAASPPVLVALQDLAASEDVWLVDHAWTFRMKQFRELKANPALQERVSSMLFGHGNATFDEIYERVWYRAATYRVATEEKLDEESCWYLLDEVGTALRHVGSEEEANIRTCPLFYPPMGCALNLMWLTAPVEEGDVLQLSIRKDRTQCPGVLPLILAMEHGESTEDLRETFRAALTLYRDSVRELVEEAEKNRDPNLVRKPLPVLPTNGTVRVATDLQELLDNLRQNNSNGRYAFVPDPSTAHIVWLTEFQPESQSLRQSYPGALFVSQMGIEGVLCNKNELHRLMRKVYGSPAWLPVSYTAATEMHFFVGDYLARAEAGENNLWILKPYCMARSMDMTISSSLPLLLRANETGPKVICKYIDRPCLFRGRKFDLRLIVAVNSLKPLNVYLYDRVWPRFALEQYNLEDLDVYEKHFTVMNYANPTKMINLLHADFVVAFDEQHGSGAWADAFEKIKQMTLEIFAAAARECKPVPGSGAVYGLDVMLTEDRNPMLLEVTFAPDCHRACEQYPTFFADVFQTLFDAKPANFTPLLVSTEGEVSAGTLDDGPASAAASSELRHANID